jgi:Ca2+-dependent lipid-binding protein
MRTAPFARQLLRLVLDELPAWVRAGRYERTDWLCGALQALWPHLERGICRELQWRAEPVLRALAPGFVRRVRVEELSLGSVAPRITGALCADDDAGSVELELDVRWSCDGRALLAFDLRAGRRLTFGVHDVSVSGLLRVRLAPLCSRLPGFAAVSLCFAAPPEVRYRLSGVGAVASSIPGFAAYLQRCLGDAVAAAAVWPRQLVFPLPVSVVGRDPAATAFTLAPAPAGVLRVTLFDAADLSPAELLGLKDVALPGGGNSGVSTSPYVLLEMPEPPGGGRAGSQLESTAHKRNNLNPRFDETFMFVVDDHATQRLRITVRAWDSSGLGAGGHSVMGETAVPLAGLRPRVAEDSYWSLSMVVPKSVTVQGVMATYRVPSFGGELEEVPAGRLRMGLLYTPFRGSPGARRGTSDDEDEEEDDDADDYDDDDEEDDDESDPSSSGEDESEDAEARRDARRAARRQARRRSRHRGRGAGARQGVLFVRVERGADLRRVTGASRPADAYVTVMLAGERRREVRKTRVVAASRSPAWNADFALFVDDAPRSELVCAAFDFSGVEAHIPMGEVRLPVLDIVAEQGAAHGVRQSYPLLGAPGGTLQLWLEWRPF